MRPCSPSDTDNRHAFAVAGSIVHNVLHTEERDFAQRLGEVIRAAFNWPEVYCHFTGQAAHLAGRRKLPENWHSLAERIEYDHQAAWLPAGGNDDKPIQLGCPLLAQGEVVGALCVQAPLATLPALQSLAELIAATLLDRLQFDERKRGLLDSEDKLVRQQQILDQIHDSVIAMDLSGYITEWNKGAEQQFGYTAEEAIGKNILFLYADEDEDVLFHEAFLEHGGREMVVKRRKKSGEVFWASLSLSLSRDVRGNPTAILGYLVDITERLKTEAELRLQAAIFEYSDEGIIVTDVAKRILSVNRSFTKITGYEAHESIGQLPSMLKSGLHDQAFYDEMDASIADNGLWIGELWKQHKSGENFPVWMSTSGVRNQDGLVTHYFSVFTDLTERKNTEQQIYRLAYHDALTGLPNRARLYTLLRQALLEAQRNKTHGAILFIDLDRFKQINDSLGHAYGDILLKEVARRLAASLRGEDIIARIGGDEFLVALVDIAKHEDASIVAQKILDNLSLPLMVEGHELQISASIGISIYPDDGDDAETLIKNADIAMYRAKQGEVHDGYMFFSPDMNKRALERLKLESNLRRALERDELVLHYQPQLNLQNGKIIGAEVLLRWNHPGTGMISPAEFIPLAEETGLIIPIGQWILETVCARNKEWQRAGLPIVKLAVNISAKQFRPTLPRMVAEILARQELDARFLELEITESMIMQNVEGVIAMMDNFQLLGIGLSLDDFGTGYSSLSYLKRFPIDKLKIDQSFVRGVTKDADDEAITRTIISLSKNLGLRVIAEGVETEEQLAFLRSAGCEEIQGYYYSRPLPEDDFVKFLRNANP
ncbi:MAG TPA: EAL domain-containing protein [Gallionella sp.]|nr:EAL domain-containing protein [Gallionella sp.]